MQIGRWFKVLYGVMKWPACWVFEWHSDMPKKFVFEYRTYHEQKIGSQMEHVRR